MPLEDELHSLCTEMRQLSAQINALTEVMAAQIQTPAETTSPVASSTEPSTDEGNTKVSDAGIDTSGAADAAVSLADAVNADKKPRRRSNGKNHTQRPAAAKAAVNEQQAGLPGNTTTSPRPDKSTVTLQAPLDAAAEDKQGPVASAFMQSRLAELNSVLSQLVAANRGEPAAQIVEEHTNGATVQDLDAIRLARLLKQLRLLLPDSDTAAAPEDKAAIESRAALTGEAQQLVAKLSVTGRGPAALDVLQRYTSNGTKVAELPASALEAMVIELQAAVAVA